jgi:hypothetical protein
VSGDLDYELTTVAKIDQATGLVFDFVPESQKQTDHPKGGDQAGREKKSRSRVSGVTLTRAV